MITYWYLQKERTFIPETADHSHPGGMCWLKRVFEEYDEIHKKETDRAEKKKQLNVLQKIEYLVEITMKEIFF